MMIVRDIFEAIVILAALVLVFGLITCFASYMAVLFIRWIFV